MQQNTAKAMHKNTAQVTPITPPYTWPVDFEAEQAVLGAILLQPSALQEVSGLLKPGYFLRKSHRIIFQCLLDLDMAGKPIDLVTVTAYLHDQQMLDRVGGPVFLANLSDQVGSAANVAHYAQRVRDKALLDKTRKLALKIIDALQRPVAKAEKFYDRVEAAIFRIGQEFRKSNTAAHLATLVQEETETLTKNNSSPGISTGFLDVDQMFTWSPGDVVVLAGRTSMGKTSLALNFALRAARNGAGVGFFSLEMTASQLTRRLMAAAGQINAERLREGKLSQAEWTSVHRVRTDLEQLNIIVDDAEARSILEIRSEARRLRAAQKLDFLIVDYLQLVKPVHRGRNREEEVSEVSRGLKAMAKELKIPVLVLAQLNRNCEYRTDRRPVMADLRESGSIENDADIVLLLYRDEYYDSGSQNKGLAEVNIAKNRNGRTGLVKLTYLEEFLRFEDYVGSV
ncbi:MAG: replicative DNA helicase [Deltaproteobacteria bacterium]|nr:replicative DNA helicase [Deltaproteobacteria bacterium]